MSAEASQEEGRRGVFLTKKWLEATTFIEMPFNVYEHASRCQIELLSGDIKNFDLSGFFLLDSKNPILVENKNYDTPGTQSHDYKEFLATAYSATKRNRNSKLADTGMEFMWVTTHPFGAVDKWRTLETEDYIRAALDEHPKLLHGETIDESTVRLVSQRTWLLVRNPKQERLTMDTNEVNQVCTLLSRRG